MLPSLNAASTKTNHSPLERWVVKVGSSLVCNGGSFLLHAWAAQLRELRKHYAIEVVWVTSGSIASAIDRVGYSKAEQSLSEKQALSAIGQPLLMDLYNLAFEANGLLGSQILVTYRDLNDPESIENFKSCVETLLRWNVVPILNENDAMAAEKIKFGDNDSLSAHVAQCLNADRLIICTDVEGLYDHDPEAYKNAILIDRLEYISEDLLGSIGLHSSSGRGSGGMYSKLRAAKTATGCGIPTWLVKGDLPNILIALAQNLQVGTKVLAIPEALEQRRKIRWKTYSNDLQTCET